MQAGSLCSSSGQTVHEGSRDVDPNPQVRTLSLKKSQDASIQSCRQVQAGLRRYSLGDVH